MKSLKGENPGTKKFINKLRTHSTMTDDEIEETGIYKFKQEATMENKPSKYQRAKSIIGKAAKKFASNALEPYTSAGKAAINISKKISGEDKFFKAKKIENTKPIPKINYQPANLDQKEKELVASGKNPEKVAIMKKAIMNRRKLASR